MKTTLLCSQKHSVSGQYYRSAPPPFKGSTELKSNPRFGPCMSARKCGSLHVCMHACVCVGGGEPGNFPVAGVCTHKATSELEKKADVCTDTGPISLHKTSKGTAIHNASASIDMSKTSDRFLHRSWTTLQVMPAIWVKRKLTQCPPLIQVQREATPGPPEL